ncbi:hypothetical protein [Streptomyces sp. NPDC050255]|uniref:hypothetical protein n=1 Tax=Streptomyces sp. NPDC050255 TaxID=3365606 RepID=UPI0037912B59
MAGFGKKQRSVEPVSFGEVMNQIGQPNGMLPAGKLQIQTRAVGTQWQQADGTRSTYPELSAVRDDLITVMQRLGFSTEQIESFVDGLPGGINATVINGKEGLRGVRVADAP